MSIYSNIETEYCLQVIEDMDQFVKVLSTNLAVINQIFTDLGRSDSQSDLSQSDGQSD